MDNEPIQIVTATNVELVSKPKELNLSNYQEYIQWKNLTIYPYLSKKGSFPFISIKDKILYAYNHNEYKWFTIFSEIVKFLGCKWDTLNYHLQKIKNTHPYYTESRDDFDYMKKFHIGKIAQERIRIIPYKTFWKLLESYKSDIAWEILDKLHEIDYERMMEDDKNQTLIEQIKGEKND